MLNGRNLNNLNFGWKMGPLKIYFMLYGLALISNRASASQDEHGEIPPLLTVKDGNSLGSKASVGMERLLTGDVCQELFDCAETPFGHESQAVTNESKKRGKRVAKSQGARKKPQQSKQKQVLRKKVRPGPPKPRPKPRPRPHPVVPHPPKPNPAAEPVLDIANVTIENLEQLIINLIMCICLQIPVAILEAVQKMLDSLPQNGPVKVPSIKKNDVTAVMGDFDVKVGKGKVEAHDRSLGLGERNSTGDRMVEFCQVRDVVLTNTLFELPDRRFDTWKFHADNKGNRVRNQIVYILMNNRFKNLVKEAKTYPDQFLVEKSDQDPHDPDLGPDQDPIQLCQIHLNRAQLQNKYGT
ncbi:hypothetical protein HUJ04_011675 [Dendroctonus ponderosae]|nr:hypothetical protein HUJ04_011675 [Dendroctonus ponderosae]